MHSVVNMIVRFKNKPITSFLCLCLAFVLTTLAQAEVANTADTASTTDLRQEKWGQGERFSLESTWLFTWQSFTHDAAKNPQYTWHNVHVPGPWSRISGLKSPQSSPVPPTGFGTYYKKILVPNDLEKVFIHLPDMASAYELWHNGKKLGGNGMIANSREQEEPGYLPSVYELSPINGEIELFILTSNYHYLWGGIWYAPTVTDESGVHKIRELPILKAMTSGTILLATFFFSFFMYLSRRQDKKLLFFSLFCLAIGVRRLCLDERVMYLLGIFDWSALQVMENVTLYLMLPLFLSYFQQIFPEKTPLIISRLGWLCALPFCFAALFFEVQTYSGFNPYFQIVVLLFLPFILICWFRAFKAKLRHSRMFGMSLLVFVVAVINDMLNYSYIIQTTNLTHLGVLAFVLFQLAGLISRYLENFRAIERLSETLKEKNKALMKHDEFKDDFLANTSHELRMPLHGMAGLARAVRKDSPELAADSKDKVRLIEATAIRLGNLVNDILDMSSLKHGKLNIQKHPTYIEPLIENTVYSLNSLIKDKPVTLDYLVEEGAKVVLADEQRLQQIFYNLIGNAIKFTHEGFIRIEARCYENQIHVLVSDSGIGMTDEQLETALHAYEMHNNQPEDELRGSGLGLSITNKLVELHGGTLNVDSKQGVGTTVSFILQPSNTLPKADLDNNTPSFDAPEIAPNRVVSDNLLTRNAMVYYADDEEVNRELVSSQLLEAGYRVKVFADGQSLLDQLEEGLPELALLDWVMPGKDGLTVCSEIREQYDATNLPVIMLTAKHQINHIVQALNAGANDYLTKPYHEQELIARVSSQISVKRLLMATIENERLKVEIEDHERQKQALSHANQGLIATLESSQENVLLLNEDLDIIYSNSGANILLGFSQDDSEVNTDSQLTFTSFITDEAINTLRAHVNEGLADRPFTLKLHHQDKVLEATLHASDIGQERFISLILNDEKSSKDRHTQELLSSLTQEIAQNRQRMEQIESTLLQLNGNKKVESVAVKVEDKATQSPVDPKELVVKTLRTTLISWERYTHKSKAELAEESHCWRVYLDGATAKTRTLDKYLSVKTLPAKPRWRAVIKTANYVLDHCELSTEDREELIDLVQQVTDAFS